MARVYNQIKKMIQFDKSIFNFLLWISLKETNILDIFYRNGRS